MTTSLDLFFNSFFVHVNDFLECVVLMKLSRISLGRIGGLS